METELNWVGWFYRHGERRVGPVPRSKIVGLVSGGQLPRSAQVWRAWNHGDEFHFVPTRAAEAVDDVAAAQPGSVAARLWRVMHASEACIN